MKNPLFGNFPPFKPHLKRKAHAASMLVVKRTKPDFPNPKNNTDIYIYIYLYINIRPSNVKALSIPIAPMAIWPPPCCFEILKVSWQK